MAKSHRAALYRAAIPADTDGIAVRFVIWFKMVPTRLARSRQMGPSPSIRYPRRMPVHTTSLRGRTETFGLRNSVETKSARSVRAEQFPNIRFRPQIRTQNTSRPALIITFGLQKRRLTRLARSQRCVFRHMSAFRDCGVHRDADNRTHVDLTTLEYLTEVLASYAGSVFRLSAREGSICLGRRESFDSSRVAGRGGRCTL